MTMISFSSSGTITVITLCLVFSYCEAIDGTCHRREVHFYPLMTGKRLENHTIHQNRTDSEDFCMVLCFMEKNCRSINFNHTMDKDGKHLCEVNNSTAKVHPKDLKNHHEYSYRETKDPCERNPCKGNEICSPQVNSMGYRCCPAGYTGDPCVEAQSCEMLAKNGVTDDGAYQLMVNSMAFKVYCDVRSGHKGWTLIARFSNADAKNWMDDSGEYWYDRTSPVGQPSNPADNRDMISPAFWLVSGTKFKITRSDDSSHASLLYTTDGCLGGQTFRSKMTSYGDFRNGIPWAREAEECLGSCGVKHGAGKYKETDGFWGAETNCHRHKIRFWCGYGHDGAVMRIAGGSSCDRADHGIGITEADQASFVHVSGQDTETEYDFGNNAKTTNEPAMDYSLNLWVR